MCKYERVGESYICGHFCGLYYSGVMTDCNSRDCKTSSSHRHKTDTPSLTLCTCPTVVTDIEKIQTRYDTKCPDCEDPASPDSTARRRRVLSD